MRGGVGEITVKSVENIELEFRKLYTEDSFSGLHICSVFSNDILDGQTARLAVFRPEVTFRKMNDRDNRKVLTVVAVYLNTRGVSLRLDRNILAFITPEYYELRNLQTSVIINFFEKICDACKELGSELPVYELRGNGLRVHFKALQSALIDQSKIPKDQPDTLDDTLANRVITLLIENPSITQNKLAEHNRVSVPSIKRIMKILSDEGKIVRIGGKRYGHWQVNDENSQG